MPASNFSNQIRAHPSRKAWLSGWGCSSMTPPADSKPGFKLRSTLTIHTRWCVAGELRDKEVLLSAHSRSVPFSLVHNFYRQLMQRSLKQQSSTSQHGGHGKKSDSENRNYLAKPFNVRPNRAYHLMPRVAVFSASIPPSFIFAQQWAIQLICSTAIPRRTMGRAIKS